MLFEQVKAIKPPTDKRLYYLDATIKSAKKGRKISLVVDENRLSEALHLEAAGKNDHYVFGNSLEQIPKMPIWQQIRAMIVKD